MKNKEYWAERFRQLEASQHCSSEKLTEDIQRQMSKAEAEIEKKIYAWYGRLAANNGVSMAEARKLLRDRELEEFRWDVEEYIKYGQENALNGKWMKELENASARVHISRLEQLKLQIQQEAEKLYGNYLDGVDRHVKSLYEEGFYKTAYEIQRGVGVGWNLTGVDPDRVDKIIRKPWAADGKNFSERIWSSKQQLIDNVHTSLTQMCILGQSPDRAIGSLAKSMQTSKNQAGRLIMTESAFFGSEARKDSFQELGVEKYEILATLDSITSEICREMDGKVFLMSEYEAGVTAPPFHVWCRSTTVPVFGDEFDNIGERAARGEDGKTYYVPAGMTYKDWKESFVDGGDKPGLQEAHSDDTIHKKNEAITSLADVSGFDELCAYMKKAYSVDIADDVMNLDFGTVKRSLTGVESVIQEYPEIGDFLKKVETTTSGVMSCTGASIKFNPVYYKRGNDLSEKCFAASQMGVWVKNCTPQTMGAHEAGHGVEWLLIQKNPSYSYDFEKSLAWSECSEAKSIVREAIENIKKTAYGKGKKKEDLIKAISQYAYESASETMAEAFHDVYANGKDANPLSMEIKKIVREKIDGYKGAN